MSVSIRRNIIPVRLLLLLSLLLLSVSWIPKVASAPGGNKNKKEEENEYDIFEAVNQNDLDSIKRFVTEEKVDINQKSGGGQTPLLRSILFGKVDAFQTLLELGADVTIPEAKGYTAFHAAAFQGRAEILKLLVDYITNNKNNEKDIPLSMYDQHADGYYPIHRACWGREQRHTDTVETFLKLGVSPTLESAEGKTCLDMTKNPETAAILLKAIERKWEQVKKDENNDMGAGASDEITTTKEESDEL